jgi:hypothetical protein
MIIEDSHDLFSPQPDPFMPSEEPFSPLNWNTPRGITPKNFSYGASPDQRVEI